MKEKLLAKKFTLIFVASFFIFLFFILALPIGDRSSPIGMPVSMPIWFALSTMIAILIAFGYQLAYMIYFCKKDGVSRSRSVATFFLCTALCLAARYISIFFDVLFHGTRCCMRVPAGRRTFPLAEMLDALDHVLSGSGGFPRELVILCLVYALCYVVISVVLMKRKKNAALLSAT